MKKVITPKKKRAVTEPLENLKEKNAKTSFRITIRDEGHFYKLVNWLNENVGRGLDKWTFSGRPLKSIRSGHTPDIKIYIFVEDFDESTSLYLTLI